MVSAGDIGNKTGSVRLRVPLGTERKSYRILGSPISSFPE
jgi:hypothetical protein